MLYFVKIGYAVIMINYRGSTNFGDNFLDSLPGHVGDIDVNDCIVALDHVLTKDDSIDVNKVVYYGGSHSGFIGAHLLARDYRIKSAVLRNPVTDIGAMLNATDIPDWCHVESGTEKETDEIASLSQMYEKSPIQHVKKVKSPVLLLIGTFDRRVPNINAYAYFHALKACGVKTRLLVYPEDNHALVKPAHSIDLLLNSSIWFSESLESSQ
eukprot:TRINITY_DN2901_c0_g1_i1.p1 TRINITY_DN2901_c0_g1~~TRINITY_DN2901_c0_g1_i1.p1  ORF type:complete len:211 (-),score=46.27 TRINITY_DN2901_c0_g1_i1:105-737(-)